MTDIGLEYDELPPPDFFFKVIIAGNAGVGKSALMQRFLFDEYTEGRVTLPVGVKCRETVMVQLREPFAVDDMLAKLILWDVECPADLEDILKLDIKSHRTGILFCYNVNDAQSFEELDFWFRVADRTGLKSTRCIVGLQSDVDVSRKAVLTSTARALATKHGLRFTRTTTLPFPHFHEASAKTGENIESAVMGLVYRMMKVCMEIAPMAKAPGSPVRTRSKSPTKGKGRGQLQRAGTSVASLARPFSGSGGGGGTGVTTTAGSAGGVAGAGGKPGLGSSPVPPLGAIGKAGSALAGVGGKALAARSPQRPGAAAVTAADSSVTNSPGAAVSEAGAGRPGSASGASTALVIPEPTAEELRWRRVQTRRHVEPPVVPPPPPVEVWPEGSVPTYCRDVAKMTLEEYKWCLTRNHWDDELQHIPAGWPDPPLMEPVWWWKGYGSRWGPVDLSADINQHSYVERWFLRGKSVVRAPFKMYFGTLETECKQEFMDAKERGSSSIQQSLAEEEAARRIASAAEAKKHLVALE